MKGDFSRDTYDKTKHFSRVLMQQGRVQLDADWNEQAAILLHYLRTLAADLIGPFAGPTGQDGKIGPDFEVAKKESTPDNFLIGGPGRYYVDGILCENETADVSYKNQQDFPNPRVELNASNSYLVYLDVWERHISSIEEDYIREKALGGPDTASRTKVIWQAKVENVTNTDDHPLPSELTPKAVRTAWGEWIKRWQPPHLGCLKVRVKQPAESHDPCLIAPDAKYRGAENQLYRVEIHTKGTAGEAGGATFKWSRDNGAIVTGCALSGAELTVHNPRGFAPNQWVELTNDGQELRGELGTLVKLLKVESDVLTLVSAPSPANTIPNGETWPTKVRRWDHSEKETLTLVGGAIPVKEGSGEAEWIDLEDGIQIQFQPLPVEGVYRTGDYWLIPARVATKDIEWPSSLPQPPHGVRHHYAPLAILTPARGDGWTVDDCRCLFPTINKCDMLSHGEDGIGGSPSCSKPRASSLKRESHLHKKPRPK